jgi:4-diphosphocytidyl-2-C-methyl-D-erythritol kinase
VVRAAELLNREVGLPGGATIHLAKRIPAGAGLGGGSSDAAGALAGLNELFALGLDRDRLAGLAAELGSDVAFFLWGGTALCEGRGERVTPLDAPAVLHYVLCCPDVHVSTAAVYDNLASLGLTRGGGSASFIVDSLARGSYGLVCEHLFNRLGDAAVAKAPQVGEARQLLSQAASRPAIVSGSGAAVYAISESEADANAVAARIRGRPAGRVFVARTEFTAT